jgi:hypothetical protein
VDLYCLLRGRFALVSIGGPYLHASAEFLLHISLLPTFNIASSHVLVELQLT